MDGLLLLIVMAVACMFIGTHVGAARNAPFAGGLLGLLLGPFGVLLTFAIDLREQCPECHGRLNGSPRLCQHCGSILRVDPPPPPPKPAPSDPRQRACFVCHEPIEPDAQANGFRLWCAACADFVDTLPQSQVRAS